MDRELHAHWVPDGRERRPPGSAWRPPRLFPVATDPEQAARDRDVPRATGWWAGRRALQLLL